MERDAGIGADGATASPMPGMGLPAAMPARPVDEAAPGPTDSTGAIFKLRADS